MITISVNGKTQQIAASATVADLLNELQLQGKRIAVELNGEIVPKSQHATTPIGQGASLEIVVAVGGG